MLIGTKNIYESTDNGRNLTPLNGDPTAPATADDKFTPNNSANLGRVNALIYGGLEPDGSGGTIQRGDIIYVGTNGKSTTAGNNHTLWVRQPNSPNLVAVTSFDNASNKAQVEDITVDPNDWRRIFVLDDHGHIWYTSDGGVTNTANWIWSDITGKLGTTVGATNP